MGKANNTASSRAKRRYHTRTFSCSGHVDQSLRLPSLHSGLLLFQGSCLETMQSHVTGILET